MTYSNIRTIDYLTDLYLKKAAGIAKDCPSNEFSRVTWKDGMKYTILHSGEVKCIATSATSFEVFCEVGGVTEKNSQTLCQAMLSDFVLNARRVKQQYQTAIAMKKNKDFAAPWILVSVYYSAFFAANEILRLNDILQVGFSSEEREQLCRRSEFNRNGNFAQFVSAKPRNFSGQVKDDRIVFVSTGDRPHEKAWELTAQQLNKVVKEKAWTELYKFVRFVEGKDGWIAPSAIRNEWNYRRSDLYSDKGRELCRHMLDIIGLPSEGFEWMKRSQPVSDSSHCSNLSALNDLLSLPIIKSYESLFVSGVLK